MTDSELWAEPTVREQTECLFWDLYKEVHGFRPRHVMIHEMSDEVLNDSIERLCEESKIREAARVAKEQKAIVAFNNRVQELINIGAKNRETAIRWIHQAEDTDGDDAYLAWTLGLPYNFFRK